ncbi:MAG: hypothetical protein JKY15_02075 [Deltaproteobacteria bacterium]|nr:hypothetical protein [Deltaproteobacteria bacterium]
MIEAGITHIKETDQVSAMYKKHNYDPQGFSVDDNLRGIMNHYTIVSVGDNPQGLKAIWEDIASQNKELGKMYNNFLADIENTNKLSREQLKDSPSFFRGTAIAELDAYLKNGTTGVGEDEKRFRYQFTAVTPNEEMADIYDSGVTIEYDGDDVRSNGAEAVTYDPFFRDLGETTETKKDGRMDANYADQAEVRMDRDIPLDKLRIKSIKIKSNDKSLIKKYESLGPVTLISDEEDN